MSIGQLIAERDKYKVKELRVVAVDNSSSKVVISEVAKLAKYVRVVIQKMTLVNPEERISAVDVHKIIFETKKVMS